MGVDELLGKAEAVGNIVEKWSGISKDTAGTIDKGVSVVGKIQDNAHKKELNELTIKAKVQELEDNKMDKAANRKRIDSIFSEMIAEHKEYVNELKRSGLFVEKKKEASEDWKVIIDFTESLTKHYT